MKSIWVVGAGPGGKGLMTGQAAEKLKEAQIVYAYERHRALADGVLTKPLEQTENALNAMRQDREQGLQVAVLVSGDPTLYSLLGVLKVRFGAEAVEVFAGVGAVQMFAAKLKVLWQNARIVSAHGRRLSESALLHLVKTEKELMLFCDQARGPGWMGEVLARAGLGHLSMQAGERLGYQEERITMGTAQTMAGQTFDALCMARIENPLAEPETLPGMQDKAFIRGETPMTKRDIRALALCDLRLPPDAVVWDIGAGTGSVSVECARLAPFGTVYAVERDEEAARLIEKNKEAFYLPNIDVVRGSAPEALKALPAPTHVFLGGSGKGMDAIFDLIECLPKPIRFCAAFVTMENAARCLKRLDACWRDISARQVAVTELNKAGPYRMLKAQNPIFLMSATLTEEKP